MASRNGGSVIIRLDLRGQEELKRRLEELGPAGERLGRDLERAMQPVKREGRLAKATLVEVGDAFEDVAREAGPVGRILASLGPAGLVAAAGIGAVAIAVREVFVLMERSREAASYGAQIENVARTTGLAVQDVQEFTTALGLVRVGSDQAGNALEEFTKRIGEFRNTGQGEARDALAVLGLDGNDFNQLPIEEALDRVLARLAEIEDPTRRLSLADKLGLQDAAPLLQGTAEHMQGLLATAQEISALLPEAVIERLAEADRRMAALEGRRDRARDMQGVAVLDLQLTRMEAMTAYEEMRARLLARRDPIIAMETEELRRQRSELSTQIELLEASAGLHAGTTVEIQQQFQELERQRGLLVRYNAELERRNALFVAPVQELFGMSNAPISVEATARARAEADLLPALERRNELEALVASQLQALMTPTERIAQLEADLNEARRIGLTISESQIDAILAEARERAGLVEGLEAELAARQAIADMSAVVPRLRPAKPSGDPSAPGGVDNPITSPEADKAKTEAAAQAEAFRRAIEADQAEFASTTARFVADGVRAGAERGWEGALDQMRRRFTDMLYDAFFESVRNGIVNALQGSGFGGGGSGVLSALAGLVGFDRGGEMLIGGNPGVDRNVVSINGAPVARVSQGERLRVEPVIGAGGGGGSGAVHQHFHLHAEGAVMTEELLESFQARANRSAAAAYQAADATSEARMRGRAKSSRYQLR